MTEPLLYLIGGSLLGWGVMYLLRPWLLSPRRCVICRKRIPAEPRDWLCSYMGSSEKEVSLFYHAACHATADQDRENRRRQEAYDAA